MRQARFLPILGLILLAAAAGAVFALPARANANANDDSFSYARIVRLSLAEGDVQVVRPNTSNKWEPAVVNMPLQQGFAIGANDGRAEIEFEHGGMMWLSVDSVAQFTELALSDGGRITQISVSRGTATFAANLAPSDSFLVTTPAFQIKAAGNSEFRVDAFDDGGSVSELKGRVSVLSLVSATAPADLAKGQTFAVRDGGKNQLALKPNPSPDDWDKWVRDRLNAATYGEQQATPYANAPVSYGLADLSMFGNWNYFPGYGYGWQPFGMTAGWAPFTDGQWMFYSGMGWTWVSGEPWGWMPYHFGSWAFSPSYGYIWVPGNYGFWNPAPVQWVSAGGRIGWRPTSTRTPTSSMPVIVATKSIGKFGRNRVVSNAKLAGQVQALAAPPLSNGKIARSEAVPGMSSRLIQSRPLKNNVRTGAASFRVPTAASLRTFQRAAGFRPGQPAVARPPAASAPMARPANAMPANAMPANAMPANAMNVPRPPIARMTNAMPAAPRMINAMPAAPRMLPPPPPRSFSPPAGFNRPAYQGQPAQSSNGRTFGPPRSSAPPRASAPSAPARAPAPAVRVAPAPQARSH